MAQFRVIREDTGAEIDDLYDVTITDTANPFGNKATPSLPTLRGRSSTVSTVAFPFGLKPVSLYRVRLMGRTTERDIAV